MLVEQLTISPSAPVAQDGGQPLRRRLEAMLQHDAERDARLRGRPPPAARARAVETSSGFSSSMCLPAGRSSLDDFQVRVGRGEHGRPRRCCGRRGWRRGCPRWGTESARANASRRAALGLMAQATSTGRARSIRLLACGVTAMPRPMRAMRWRGMRWGLREQRRGALTKPSTRRACGMPDRRSPAQDPRLVPALPAYDRTDRDGRPEASLHHTHDAMRQESVKPQVCDCLQEVLQQGIGAFKVQSFAAKQRDCFGFDFAQVLWCSFRVGKVGFGGVT